MYANDTLYDQKPDVYAFLEKFQETAWWLWICCEV